jgi:hypothetical protein
MLSLSYAQAPSPAGKVVLPVPTLSSLPSTSSTIQSVSPFTITGFLQKATLNIPDDPFSGGIMEVNGYAIKVPSNTSVNMPGTLLRWSDLFSLAPKPWGPKQTGMALADMPKPLTTYEVIVQGNRTISNGHDEYDAGLIFVSQQSVNSGQGFINFIDYTTGEIRVGGVLNESSTGSRVRLNDPLGRFGRAMSPDRRFSIDENNPTVRTATGYPMCIPRVNLNAATSATPVADDPLCPQINRPKDTTNGGFLRQFFMQPPPCSSFPVLPTGVPSVTPPGCTLNPAADAPDATKQMPFEVGDYVTFQGALQRDTASPACASQGNTPSTANPACEYISAWSVIANLGAFTAPGTMPAYVAVDLAQIGTGGIPNPGLPQEATANARVEGFTTDPTEPVDIFGIDIDACSGKSNDRYWGTQPILQIGQLGKFRFNPLGGTFTPPVREVRAVSQTLSNGAIPASITTARTYANGLIAGQYDAPITRFIFPESAEVGLARIPLNLQDFPFLAEGFMTARCTASLTPATLSFSDQAPGTTSAPQTVTLTNTGIGALNVTKVSVTDGFTQTNNCGSQLAVGSSCSMAVTFKAGTARLQTGVLEVIDSTTAGPQRVSLIGTVAQPAIATFVPSTLTFGDQAPGTKSAPQILTLTNSGGADLKINNVRLTIGYMQTNRCPMTLKPGATCTFTVMLDPTSVGAQSGTLAINDNAAGSPHIVTLNGASSDFFLRAAQPSASVYPGQTASYSLDVVGTSLAAGNVNLSCSDLPAGSQCTVTPSKVTLHGTQHRTVAVSITTAGRTSTAQNRHGSIPLGMTLLGGFIAAVFTRRRPQKLIIGVVAICALMLNGCGGGVNSLGGVNNLGGGTIGASQQGSRVTITATSSNGALHSVALDLLVKPRPTPNAGRCPDPKTCQQSGPLS